MAMFQFLGLRACIALGLVPLVVLMVAVSVVVDKGFHSIERATENYADAATQSARLEKLERCLSASQQALVQYFVVPSETAAQAFQRNLTCLKDTAASQAPEFAQSIDTYAGAFAAVVRLADQEAALRESADRTSTQALGTLSRIIKAEVQAGGADTIALARDLKDDIVFSVASLNLPMWDGISRDLAASGDSVRAALAAQPTAQIQAIRADTLADDLKAFEDSLRAVMAVHAERRQTEQAMVNVIAPQVATEVAARRMELRVGQSQINSQIAASVAQTRQRIAALSYLEFAVALLLVALIGGWVAGAVRNMAHLMTRIASGEDDVHVPGTGRSNELGAMARALEVFQDNARLRVKAETHAEAAQLAAETDPVTGFGNRRAIDKELSSLTTAQFASSALALIDLNAFKPINDNFGHDAGDTVLQKVGQRLDERFHHQGCVARLGGDEFGILIRNAGQPEALHAAGETILSSFQEPIQHGAEHLHIGASVGLVALGPFGSDLESAWKAADTAMFEIKKQRRTGFAIHDHARPTSAKEDIRADEIARALETGALVPFFQPQFDLATNDLVGLEAVMRWRHPDLGLIGPDRFFEAIKTYGMIQEYTNELLCTVLKSISFWREIGRLAPLVTVNIHESYISTDQGLDALLVRVKDEGMSGADIAFQIAEAALVSRVGTDVRDGIKTLHDNGFRIGFGDFGSGFGALRMLQDLPIGGLKIGNVLTQDIGISRDSETLIKCIVNLASGLGLTVVAGGVDTDDQQSFLDGIGCRLGQSDIRYRALTAESIAPLLVPAPPSKVTAAAS